MSEQCFYCNDRLEQNYSYAPFHINQEDTEKPLCEECYREWLEGIKG